MRSDDRLDSRQNVEPAAFLRHLFVLLVAFVAPRKISQLEKTKKKETHQPEGKNRKIGKER